jgi:hypothetical protein
MPQEQTAKMQQHLDDGCPKCSKTVRMWRKVLEFATREASYQPPKSVIRSVKEAFAQHTRRPGSRRQAMVASLVFDSFRQPMPAGIRASHPHARQLLYSIGDYMVDLRVQGSLKRVSLVGQVLNSSKPQEALKCLPVVLLREDQPLTQSITSPLGEFEFEFEPVKDLRLAIGLDSESSLLVPLQDVKPPSRRVAGSWHRGPRPRLSPGGRSPFRED